jgi:flavin reductase (DIM6/NTAB) family NADH-FMN oxidoreductase RutF
MRSKSPRQRAFAGKKGITASPRIELGVHPRPIFELAQEHIYHKFASGDDKFRGVDWRPAPSGSPILERAVAWIDCEIDAEHPAGDHLIVVGRVLDLHVERVAPSLIFFQGGYASSAAPAPSHSANRLSSSQASDDDEALRKSKLMY